MNSAVASVLNKVLGDFVENLNADQLNISVFSGSLNLENLRIKRDAIEAFGLPFTIKQGSIGRIKAEIPWTSLSSSPLKIEIDSVFVHIVSSPTHEWVAKNQDKRLLKEKLSALSSFELYNSEELAVVAEPGYLEKLITKVLNNLQISITGVHVRIDDFESSVKPYCVGFVLKSVSAFTCNKQWHREFIDEGNYTYKLAQIEDLCVYLDDNLDLRRTGELSTFQRLSVQEVNEVSPSHKFLVHPALVLVKIILNKSPRDLSSPQIHIELDDCTLKTKLEAQQLTHVFKLLEFLSYYNKFCKGYEASLPVKHLSEAAANEYRSLYKRWKLSVLSSSSTAEADQARLIEVESGIPLNELIANRKIAISEITIERIEETKKKEMSEIESSGKGLMSGFKGFFGSKSKAEKEKEENDKQLRLSKVQAELGELATRKEQLREEFKELLESTESFINLPPEFVRFAIKLNFRLLSFDLGDSSRELFKFSVRTIAIDIGLRQESFRFELHLGSADVADKIMNSSVYPLLMEVDFIRVTYDEYPEKSLTIRSGNASLVYNIDSVLEVIGVLQISVASQFDLAYYAQQASGLVEKYIASGQNYLAQVITGKYANKSLAIDFEIKAPELTIPFDLYSDRGAFKIDLGKIKATSRKAFPYIGDIAECVENEYLYDTYKFDLVDLLVLSVNNEETHSLLNKVSAALSIQNCVTSNHPTKPGLVLDLKFSDLEATLSDTVFAQVLELHERTLKLIESKIPMRTPTELTFQAREVDLSEIKHFIAMEVNFEVSAIRYLLCREKACVLRTQLAELKGQFRSNIAGDFECSVSLTQLVSLDERPEILYRKIISNPKEDDTSQLELFISKNRDQGSLTVRALVKDIRVVLCPETVALIQSFMNPSTSPVAGAVLQGARKAHLKVALAREVKSELTVNAELKNFEIWLPSDALRQGSQIASLSFSSDLSVSRTSIVVYKLATDRIILSREVKLDDLKANFNLNNLLLQTGVEEGMEISHSKHLLPSTLLNVSLNKFENEFDQCQTVTLQTSSLHINIGFSDVYTLQTIAHGWTKLDTAFAKKKGNARTIRLGREGYIFSCKELSLSLDDDVSKRIVPLATAKLSNVGLSAWLTRGTEVVFGAELSAYFFNQKLAAWEPLLDPYKVEFWAVQEAPKDPFIVRLMAAAVMNLNLSYEMLHSVLRLKHRLLKELEWKESNRSSRLLLEQQYTIVNCLGIPISVWLSLDPADTRRVLVKGEAWEFSNDLLKAMYARAAQRLRVPTPEHIPAFLVIEIGTVTYKVSINDTKTVGFTAGMQFIVDVTSTRSTRTISIESGVRFMNNTDLPLTLTCNSEIIQLGERNFVAIPLNWFGNSFELSDLTHTYKLDFRNIEVTPLLRLRDANVCIDQLCYSVEEGQGEVTVIQVNPSMTLRNCLPGTLRMVGEDGCSVDEGEEVVLPNLYYDETLQLAWEVDIKGMSYRGLPAKIPRLNRPVLYSVRGRIVTTEVLILAVTKRLFLFGENLDLRFKKITRSTNKAFEFTVSAQYIVVNQTSNSIELSPMNTVILPHSIGLYATDDRAISLRSIGDSISSWSNTFSIDTPGVTGTVSVKNNLSSSVDLGVSLMEGYGACSLSKVIQVAPRFIVMNNLDIPMYFRPYRTSNITMLTPGETSSFTTPATPEPKALQLSDDGHTWSESFHIEEIEDFVFKVRSASSGAAWYEANPANYFHRFFRVTITTKNEATLLIVLSQPKEPEYVVSNRTHSHVSIRQGDGPAWEVPAMTDLVYAYDDLKVKNKRVRLSIGRSSRLYSFEKIKRNKPLSGFNVTVVPQCGQKILQISEGIQALVEAESGKTLAKTEVDFSFGGICLSVIDESPKEVLVLSLQKIALKGYSETIKQGTDIEVRSGMDVSIGSVQLDNLLDHQQAFSVLLAPTEFNDEVPYFQLGVHKTVTTAESGRIIERFPLLTVLLQETKVQVDYMTVLELTSKIVRLLESSKSKLDEDTSALLSTEVDKSFEASKSSKTYFEVLQLAAIKLNISTRVPSKLPESTLKNNIFRKVLKALLHVANIHESCLHFNSLILMHSFQTVGTITNALAMNYGRQAIFQFYKVLGSSDLLGNPIGLIDNLGTGVIEFFSEPYKGLIKGPDAFVGGVSKGVKSLVGNVVSGGFGSVSKIAGSLHDIVKEVGGDRKLSDMEKKESIMQGVKGGVMDMASGVKGLFSKPIKGAKKSGVKGFFKGIGTGVIGAVSSPVAAVLRVGGSVAKTIAEGGDSIKETKVVVERGHVRLERYIGSSKIIEAYDKELAEAQHLLKKSQRFASESIQLCQNYREATVILTDQHFLLLTEGRLTSSTSLNAIVSLTASDPSRVVISTDRSCLELTTTNPQHAGRLALAVASLK
mmetsp:Transcript_31579/g.54701  ORF Transcript_31579/g.54701 Transcript_31579/m.54701 type:complete len:2374 (-) Transcript_31579:14-7135(-)